MNINNYRRLWRLLNTILITLSLFLPWFVFYFDIPVSTPPIGGVFLLLTLQTTAIEFYMYGFDLFILLIFLTGFSGVLIILYLVFNLISLIKNKDSNNKFFIVIFIGFVVLLSFYVIAWGEPLLGYWLVNIGLISSAILEWHNKVID